MIRRGPLPTRQQRNPAGASERTLDLRCTLVLPLSDCRYSDSGPRSGVFTSGLFTLKKTTTGGVTSYYYAFYANFSGSQKINGSSSAVVGSVSETLAVLGSYLGTGTIQTGLIDVSQQYEPVYIADTGNNRIVQTADILGSNWASLVSLFLFGLAFVVTVPCTNGLSRLRLDAVRCDQQHHPVASGGRSNRSGPGSSDMTLSYSTVAV